MKKKLLLVQSPDNFIHHRYPPLGLAYLAAIAESRGWEVKVAFASSLNPQKAQKQIIRQAGSFRPDIIGISILTFGAPQSYRLANLLSGPGRLIIAGGPHPSVLAEETLAQSACDIVVRGEAEATFADLLSGYEEGHLKLEKINGISFKSPAGIRHNPERPLLTEPQLNALPLPAKHLFLHKIYATADFGNIASSRGCPFDCTFCSKAVFKNTHRRRSVESVLKEIRHLKERYGINHFYFVDDIFSLRREWVEELCLRLIEADLGISWRCFCRIDSVDAPLLKKMKQAGCLYIIYGAESIEAATLENIKKGISAGQTRRALEMTHDSGIGIFLSLIWGFPGETQKDAQRLLDFLKEIYPWLYFIDLNRLVVFPGTSLYESSSRQYGFSGWWLNNRMANKRLHLYQQLRSYYPYTRHPFFPVQPDTLRTIEQAYALSDRRLILTTAMISKQNGKYVVLEQEKVQACLFFRFRRLIKLTFIRSSLLLAEKTPWVELNLLVPLYTIAESLWKRMNAAADLFSAGPKDKK